MSTRANILVVCQDGKFKFQCNSSAYPSEMMQPIIKFAISSYSHNAIFEPAKDGFYPNPDSDAISTFISDAYLTLGSVGNASYYYEIDFVKQHVKVWENQMYWHNAPEDWKAKGWQGVYENHFTGKMGFTDWRRGKLIYINENLRSFMRVVTVPETSKTEMSQDELKFAENCD